MLAAVICFVSVLSTTSLASFGMDSAKVLGGRGSGGGATMTGADEDIVRVGYEGEDGCLLLYEFFAAVAILVSILYYAIVKATLMAMGAVLMTPPNPHPLYDNHGGRHRHMDSEEDDETEEHADEDGDDNDDDDNDDDASLGISSSSSSSDENGKEESESVISVSSPSSSSSSLSPRKTNALAGRDGVEMKELKRSNSCKDGNDDEKLFGIEIEEATLDQARTNNNKKKKKKKKRSTRRIPPSDSIEFDGMDMQPEEERTARSERFNAVKIWTNIYGLSMGIYCLVYSLLLPNELSAFVFCVASLLAGIHEAAVPCLRIYLQEDEEGDKDAFAGRNGGGDGGLEYDDDDNGDGDNEYASLTHGPSSSKSSSDGHRRQKAGKKMVKRQDSEPLPPIRRARRGGGWKRQFKRCLGWMCLFQSSMAHEVKEAAHSSKERVMKAVKMVNARRRNKKSHAGRSTETAIGPFCLCCSCSSNKDNRHRGPRSSLIGSGVLVMPCIVLLMMGGLACKIAQAVMRKGANVMENTGFMASLMNSTSFFDHSEKDVNSNYNYYSNHVPLFQGGEGADNPGETSMGVASTAVNILFPIVGVLMLKSMRKAENVRETIELAVPVCGLNSLCIVCMILIQAPSCLMQSLSSTIAAPHVEADDAMLPVTMMPWLSNQSTAAAAAVAAAQQQQHEHLRSTASLAVVRYEPILAALALPFPLVCSIVCIVAAGRNHRVMDIAASIYLAYASRRFQSKQWIVREEDIKDQDALAMYRTADAMGGLAMAYACMVCLALAAYRMSFGDDHGHASYLYHYYSYRRRRNGVSTAAAAEEGVVQPTQGKGSL